MQRIPELQPLSRDHHQALVLANRCRKLASQGESAAASAQWRVVRQRFLAELQPHFRAEELSLIAPLQRLGEERLLNRLLEDHGLIQAYVFNGTEPTPTLLARFGTLLAAHVRFEERQLFDCIQTRFTPEEQQRVLSHSLAASPAHS